MTDHRHPPNRRTKEQREDARDRAKIGALQGLHQKHGIERVAAFFACGGFIGDDCEPACHHLEFNTVPPDACLACDVYWRKRSREMYKESMAADEPPNFFPPGCFENDDSPPDSLDLPISQRLNQRIANPDDDPDVDGS